MPSVSNDNPAAFQTFMFGYWNQMAREIHGDLRGALSDFRATEGDGPHRRLIAELRALHAEGRFPRLADIRSAYTDPFWKDYDRILVREDLELSGALAGDFDGS